MGKNGLKSANHAGLRPRHDAKRLSDHCYRLEMQNGPDWGRFVIWYEK